MMGMQTDKKLNYNGKVGGSVCGGKGANLSNFANENSL